MRYDLEVRGSRRRSGFVASTTATFKVATQTRAPAMSPSLWMISLYLMNARLLAGVDRRIL
jgi:hypothetical protein